MHYFPFQYDFNITEFSEYRFSVCENFIKKYAEIKNCLQYVLKFDCFALQLGA